MQANNFFINFNERMWKSFITVSSLR